MVITTKMTYMVVQLLGGNFYFVELENKPLFPLNKKYF